MACSFPSIQPGELCVYSGRERQIWLQFVQVRLKQDEWKAVIVQAGWYELRYSMNVRFIQSSQSARCFGRVWFGRVFTGSRDTFKQELWWKPGLPLPLELSHELLLSQGKMMWGLALWKAKNVPFKVNFQPFFEHFSPCHFTHVDFLKYSNFKW